MRADSCLSRRFFVLGMVSFAVARPALAGDEEPSPPALFHRFDIGPANEWSDVRVPLNRLEWHFGSVTGPAPSVEEWRAVLDDLERVAIGGRCAGTHDGPIEYPCGFALAELSIDGIEPRRFTGIALGAPTVAIDSSDVHGEPGSVETKIEPGHGEVMRPVQVVTHVLRRASEPGARTGGNISFRFKGVSNGLQTSAIDLWSGVVELRAAPRRAPAPNAESFSN